MLFFGFELVTTCAAAPLIDNGITTVDPNTGLEWLDWPAAGFTDTELGWSDGTGGCRCREGSSAASSSLKP
jgi:hypothetical protein